MFLCDAVWVVNMRRKRFLEHEINSVSLYVCSKTYNIHFSFFGQVGVENRVFKPCCVGGKYEKEAFFGT